MIKCRYCSDTGKYKQPNDQEKFEDYIEREMDKAYHVNRFMAEEKAYKKFGYTLIDCPYCKNTHPKESI